MNKPVKKSKTADPNRIKKPKSSFLHFSIQRRSELLKQDPNRKPVEMSVQIGAEWKQLTESEKAKYNAMYEEEKRAYEATLGMAGISISKVKTNQVDVNVIPKLPMLPPMKAVSPAVTSMSPGFETGMSGSTGLTPVEASGAMDQLKDTVSEPQETVDFGEGDYDHEMAEEQAS
jgi:hypothetical protein